MMVKQSCFMNKALAVLFVLLESSNGNNSSLIASYHTLTLSTTPDATTNNIVMSNQSSNGVILQPTRTVSSTNVPSILTTHYKGLDGSHTHTQFNITPTTTVRMILDNNSDGERNAMTPAILPLWLWAILLLSGVLIFSSSLIVITLIGARCLWHKRRKYYTITHLRIHVQPRRLGHGGLEEQETGFNDNDGDDVDHQIQESNTATAAKESTGDGNRRSGCNVNHNRGGETTTDPNPRVESAHQHAQLPHISDESGSSGAGDQPLHNSTLATGNRAQERVMPKQLQGNRSDTSLLSIDNVVPTVSTFRRAPCNKDQISHAKSTHRRAAPGDMEMLVTAGFNGNVNSHAELVAVSSPVNEVTSAT